MLKYIARRLVYLVFVFFILTIILFVLYKSVPGDPVRLMLDSSIQSTDPVRYKAAYDAMRISLGLDKPLHIQYFRWIGKMLIGDFGFSTQYLVDVKTLIAPRLMNTFRLNIVSISLIFLITIPLGIITATKKFTLFDNVVQIGTVIGFSIPAFIIALILIFIFAVKIPIFPVSGMNSPGFAGEGLERAFDTLRHMGLPIITIVISQLGSITRYIRGAMIESLRMDYIRTARAKGLREKVVIYSHAFRNALIPVVTVVTSSIIGLFSGSVIIESMYLWNGIGKMLIDSLKQLDYSVVLTMQMFQILISLVGFLIMDIAYCIVDPRVKLG